MQIFTGQVVGRDDLPGSAEVGGGWCGGGGLCATVRSLAG